MACKLYCKRIHVRPRDHQTGSTFISKTETYVFKDICAGAVHVETIFLCSKILFRVDPLREGSKGERAFDKQ
jgi:hypothetical protein